MRVESLTLGGDSEYTMKRFGTNQLLTGASWTSAAGEVRPSCFPRSESRLSIGARLGDVAPIPEGTAIRAESAAPYLRFEGQLGASGRADLTQVAGALDDHVAVVGLELDWSHQDAEGEWVFFHRTGPVRVFQTLDPPWHNGHSDLTLEKACTFAAGCSDRFTAARAICEGIAHEVHYDHQSGYGGDELQLLADFCAPPCEAGCVVHANLMYKLCSAVGVQVDKTRVWGGYPDRENRALRVTYWFYDTRKGWTEPSMQVAAQAADDAPQNPHFGHHEQIALDGTVYDPSYGTQGIPDLLELSGGGTRPEMRPMTGVTWFMTEPSDWPCDHSRGIAGGPVLRRPSGPGRGPEHVAPPPIAAIEVHGLARVIAEAARMRGREASGEGFVYRFDAPTTSGFYITVGIFPDENAGWASFERQRDSIESPGGWGAAESGDDVLVWPRTRVDGIAGLLYRRSNLVLYLLGRFGALEIEEVAKRVGGATSPISDLVRLGVPVVPEIDFAIGAERGLQPAVPWSRDEAELRLSVEVAQDQPPVLHAVSPELARVRVDPPALLFDPVHVGPQECVVVALAETGVVARKSLRIDVLPAPP